MRAHSIAFFVTAFTALGCGQVLGLEEFTEAQPRRDGSGGDLNSRECIPNAAVSCFSGPAAQADVGVCKSGTKTCGDRGWGPCEGEVLAAITEDCSNQVDDDCNGKVNDGCPCAPEAISACYSGPSATDGVGACKPGVHTCLATGDGYGDCVGDTLPTTEDCYLAGDEDCDDVACSDALWLKTYGGNGAGEIHYIESSPNGDLLVAGSVGDGTSTVDFGCGTLSTTDTNVNFIVKIDKNGQCIWQRIIENATISSLATSHTGDVAVGVTNNSTNSGAIWKYSQNGDTRWGVSCSINWVSLAFDPNDDIVAFGTTMGENPKCDYKPIAPGAYLQKLTGSTGAITAEKPFTYAVFEAPHIGFDTSGNTIIASQYAYSAKFDSITLTSEALASLFVAKFAPNWTHIWSKSYGETGSIDVGGSYVMPSGDIIIGATTNGTLKTGGSIIGTDGTYHALLIRLSSSGESETVQLYNGALRATAFAANEHGDAFIAGTHQQSLNWIPDHPTEAGNRTFVAEFRQGSEDPEWIKSIERNDWTIQLAPSGDGGIFIAGATQSSLTLPPIPSFIPASVEFPTLFIARLSR